MDEWTRRIERAAELTRGDETQIMTTYGQLLMLQRACDQRLHHQHDRLTGDIDTDQRVLRNAATDAVTMARTFDPTPLVAPAELDGEAIDAILQNGWQQWTPDLYSRIVLQPYAERLKQLGRRPVRGVTPPNAHSSVCPFCGGPPQLAILRGEGQADGGSRLLLCAMCATTWPIRRLFCAACGEDNADKLPYFHAPGIAHVRLDTCESCRRYLKTIDLTRLGAAVPLVDEVAAAVLDVWAVQQGWQKISINLVGL